MDAQYAHLTPSEYSQVTQVYAALHQHAAADHLPAQALQRCLERTARLAALFSPACVLIASLLVPILRRELLTEAEMLRQFPARSIALASHVSRILYHDFTDTANRKRQTTRAFHAEKLRQLFIQTYHDPACTLIVAADRLTDMATLRQIEEAEQQRWAQETLSVYLPLFEMLGLWDYRRELGNISLELVNPSFYRQLSRHITGYHERHDSLFEHIRSALAQHLTAQGITGSQITIHDTTAISLYQRMERARRRGGKFNADDANILVIDVTLDTVQDCYHTLGIIHNEWRPAHRNANYADRRFYDYIAAPRYNGYRCLITTILCEHRTNKPVHAERNIQRLVEFRICTHAMQSINEKGYAAAVRSPAPIKNAWWQNQTVRDLVINDAKPTQEETAQIGIFTPSGELIHPVRKGSTMVDMAFRIHAHLGPFARRFWVNGRQVNFAYELAHLDLIEIEYDPQFPSITPEWEHCAGTSVARASIRRSLREMDRSPQQGRQLIQAALTREEQIYQMRFSEEKTEALLTRIAQQFNLPNADALCVRVSEGDFSADEVVMSMLDAEITPYILLGNGDPLPAQQRVQLCRCWAQEREPRKYASSTRVIPGVPIVGRLMGTEKNAPIIVHRTDCRNAPRDASALPLRWRSTSTPREIAEVTITAPPRAYVAGMVLNAIYAVNSEDDQRKLGLHRFNAEMQDGSLFINLIVDAPTQADLETLQQGLQAIRRGNYISDFRMWQLLPNQKLAFAGRSDKRRQNPYTLRQVRDQSMFFGRRAEIEQIIDYVQEERTFVVIYGQKRIGKTSLMYQLAEHLLPQSCNVLPIMFDAHSLSPFTTQSFLLGLSEAAMRKLPQKLRRWEDRKGLSLRERDLLTDPFGRFAAWVKRVEQRLQGTRLIFMIDEFTRAEEECRRGNLDASFFDGLQYLAGSEDVGLILCVHDTIFHADSLSWEMFQRGQPVRLLALDREAAARLVRQPLERLYVFDEKLIDAILDLTDCHPYFIQAICLSLITLMSQKDDERITSDDLHQVKAGFLATGDHYFSHYRSITNRLGWEILKILAYLTDDEDHRWATSEAIRQNLSNTDQAYESWVITKTLDDLLQTGVVEAREVQNRYVMYRIPIGLLRLWLRRITHPLMSRDLQGKDRL